jgi:hypothetical protein
MGAKTTAGESLKTSLTIMLEYYKTVLGNVTFDAMLFRKELRKAMKSLKDTERSSLKDWLKCNGIL